MPSQTVMERPSVWTSQMRTNTSALGAEERNRIRATGSPAMTTLPGLQPARQP
jgi:hypothetical protein